MKERTTPEGESIERKITDANSIQYQALSEVTLRYGSGFNDDIEPTIHDNAYHNMQHSLRVRNAAMRLASDMGLSKYDIALVGMIAAAHDVIHEPTEETSEERSARWLSQMMLSAGFTNHDITTAETAILGTTPLLNDAGNYTGQLIKHLKFDTECAYQVAFCVAAADMEAVLSAHGPQVAHDLFKEHRGIGSNQTPKSLEGLARFQEQQIMFVQNFTPLDPKLENYFGGLRYQILTYNQALLDDIQAERLSTWEEVAERDNAFLRSYSPK